MFDIACGPYRIAPAVDARAMGESINPPVGYAISRTAGDDLDTRCDPANAAAASCPLDVRFGISLSVVH